MDKQSNDRCLVSIVCLSTPPPSTVTFSSSGGNTARNDLVTSSHGSLIPDDYEVVEKQLLKQEYGEDVIGMMVVSPFAMRYKPNIAVIVEDINIEALPLYSKKQKKKENHCSKFIFEECVASNVVSKGPKKANKPKKSHICFGPRKTRKKVPKDKMKVRKRKKAKNGYKQQSFFWVYAIVLKMARNNKTIAPKKVFKRDKGSVKSANGFSSQITVNYTLKSKSYKAMKRKCLLLFARKAYYITRLSIADTGDQPEFQNIVVCHALLHCRFDDDCYTDSGGDTLSNFSSSATHALLNNEQYIVFERDKEKLLSVTNCIALCVCLHLISTIIYSATAGLPLLALYSSTLNKKPVLCDLLKMYIRICIFQTKSNTAVSANVMSTILTGSANNLDCIENSPATIFLTHPAMPYDPDPPWYWYLSSLLGICAFTSLLPSQVQQSSLNNEKVFDMIKNGRYLHYIQNCTVIPFVLHLQYFICLQGMASLML